MLGCGAGARAGCMDRGEVIERELDGDSVRHVPIRYELQAKRSFFANDIEMQGNEVSSLQIRCCKQVGGRRGIT
jgi:hypothetical protein